MEWTKEDGKKLLKLLNHYRYLYKKLQIRNCKILKEMGPEKSLRELGSYFGKNKDTIAKWLKDEKSFNEIMNLQHKSPNFIEDLEKEIDVLFRRYFISKGKDPLEYDREYKERERAELKKSILEGKETYAPNGKDWYKKGGLFEDEKDLAIMEGMSIEWVKRKDNLIVEVSKEIQKEGGIPDKEKDSLLES
jgi:hypothetical protein